MKLSDNATESIGEKLDAKTEIGATGKTNYALALPPYIRNLSVKDLARSWLLEQAGHRRN